MTIKNPSEQPQITQPETEKVEQQKTFDLKYFQEIVNSGKLSRDQYLEAVNQALAAGILIEDESGEDHDQELRQKRASFIFFIDPCDTRRRYLMYNKEKHTNFSYKVYKTLAGPFMTAMVEFEKIKKEKVVKQQKEFEARLVKKPLGEGAKDWQDQLKEVRKKMTEDQELGSPKISDSANEGKK
ncbi:MAG: hypothetical protein AAB465_02730 [Patescibacteria group bacterium]